MKNNIKDLFNELQEIISIASLNYDIWWIYNGSQTRPKYSEVFNEYLLFFSTSMHVHFLAILNDLYRLYETRKDTINLPKLISLLKEEETIPEETLSIIKQLTAEAKKTWTKICILRNEVFSHRRLDLDTDTAFEKANVTLDQIKELIELSKKILNALNNAYEKGTYDFDLSATKDITSVLDKLKRSQ